MIRTLLFLGVCGVVAWVAFTVPLGGATLASHLSDVWRSDVVQQKMALVEHGVEDELSQRLAAAAKDQVASARTHRGEGAAQPPAESLSEADRADLEKLLQKP
jgi:hypothetical protein